MISGIHLATALSVMLHMEQEGNGMDTKEVIYRLRDASKEDEGSYANAVMRVWGPLPEFQMYLDLSFAADRLSEQQQLIDALASRLEFISTALTDHGYSDYGPMKEAVNSALSLAKGYTKDAE